VWSEDQSEWDIPSLFVGDVRAMGPPAIKDKAGKAGSTVTNQFQELPTLSPYEGNLGERRVRVSVNPQKNRQTLVILRMDDGGKLRQKCQITFGECDGDANMCVHIMNKVG